MFSALAFLTPLGRASKPGVRTMEWFAFVGAAIGLAVGVVWWGASKAFPPLVAAGLTVAADAVLTGGLHLDGLADTADGLLPPLSRERRLDVMRDPALGAFGAVALATVILLRFASLSATRPAVLVVAGMWGLSRAAMAVMAWTMPYARDDGLASAFLTGSDYGAAGAVVRPNPGARAGALLGAGLATCIVLALLGRGGHGLAALAATAAGCAAVALFAWKRIGGFTGDVLGAAGVMGETIGLVVLSARWT